MRMESGSLINTNIQLRNKLEVAIEALKFYSNMRHFDTIEGRIRIIDTGGVAEEALKIMDQGSVQGKDVGYMRWSIAEAYGE